ncbi:hypothetical protein Dvar_11020 [Desulfosarcina variabilis str. Montpellier]|uniref:SHOCT domain-containing protein n=1 Tax=Desulfosarcina variabilis TaxID=2300 RepID=UPI003AFB2325
MQHLTIEGQNLVNDISSRYQLSQDAVIHMLIAVNNGGGSMAQFNCPELGGSGQWMRGGMTMVGDMFNHGLKNTVDNLCNELSNALAAIQVFPPASSSFPSANQWWPQELGSPFSSGAQNDIRYAVFPQRLAIERNGNITVYDTLDHQIGGVSQQQGGDTSLSFSSQYGTISVSSLPIVSGPGVQADQQTNFATPPETEMTATAQDFQNPSSNQSMEDIPASHADASSSDEILNLIEKLARLRDNGVISDEEFNTKKSELLSRL